MRPVEREEAKIGIIVSVLLITAGAIMRVAVSATSKGLNVRPTGVILMVVGVIGAVLSIAFWASGSDAGDRHRSRGPGDVGGGEPADIGECEIL